MVIEDGTKRVNSTSPQTLIFWSLTVDLLSTILDTDYSRWAVIAQCSKPTGAKTEPRFFSTRIMARSRSLGASDLAQIQAAVQDSRVGAPYKYGVEQDVCTDDAA